jgi:hypothetical protein
MNTLAYQETGGAGWPRPMPTFLVDGEDLVRRLLGAGNLGVAGIGATVPNVNAFLAVGKTVFHQVPDQQACRQGVLDLDLGDNCGAFVTATVSRSAQTITWSRFESCEGVRTPLLPVGPFVFPIEQYVEVLAPVCFRGFREVQRYWPLEDDVLRTTWAWKWRDLHEEMARFPKLESAVPSLPQEWQGLSVQKQARPWWRFW